MEGWSKRVRERVEAAARLVRAARQTADETTREALVRAAARYAMG